jgi:glycine dehydrogenase subunit 1
MHRFIPNTMEDRKEMLKSMNMSTIEDLFVDIPKDLRLCRELDLEESKSEFEVSKLINEMMGKNKNTEKLTCFLGAGAYDHFVPTVVNHLASRQEFATAYTPYQPEISQGTLQVIFEYQSLISELTGMYVSNASMYDGPTACAEAAMMAVASSKKAKKIIVSETVNPETIKIIRTYLRFKDIEIITVPQKDGETDYEKLEEITDNEVAGIVIQNPNFYGVIEDVKKSVEIAHKNKSLLIDYVDPISLAILEAPGKQGVDVVVGEGQSLGNDLNLGGPYLGFFATTEKLVRKVPGRICGQSIDNRGNRAFVLTLQAREQHIRRYKATSNICSNQGLIALRATIYMALMGKEGLKEVALKSLSNSHYALKKLTENGKYKLAFDKPFFKEFTLIGEISTAEVNEKLLQKDILGGYDLSPLGMENSMVLCVTEKRTKEEIDTLASVMEVI